jgi:hypothetical protein
MEYENTYFPPLGRAIQWHLVGCLSHYTFTMKIAAFLIQGTPSVGTVNTDLNTVSPFVLSQEVAALGALPIIEALARGDALPPLLAPVALAYGAYSAPASQYFLCGQKLHRPRQRVCRQRL